ncbi:unnamed protein product, partial [Iphiclides podalirius]
MVFGHVQRRIRGALLTMGNSLMVRRSFLQKEDRRSRARVSWPFLSTSSRRSSEGSERTATSPTGRRAIAPAPSGATGLSKHTGPMGHSSLAAVRTRSRDVCDCRPPLADTHAPHRRGRPPPLCLYRGAR